MMADMLLVPGDKVCGVPALIAREATRIVSAAQWCSAGVVARELHVSTGNSPFAA
jgi:hypothetical protein